MARIEFLGILGFLALAACEHGAGGDGQVDAVDRVCGGITCAPTEFCDFSTNTCGSGLGETGTCQPRSQSCADPSAVCGCDGRIYDNACDARSVGVDLDANGNCALEADQFNCGFKQCSLTGQVCQRIGPGSGGLSNSSFACVSIPPACSASPTCDCLLHNPVGLSISTCHGNTATGLIVVSDPA